MTDDLEVPDYLFGLSDKQVTNLWMDALTHCYEEARAARLADLRGTPGRSRGFDSRGVHAFSENVGRVRAYEALVAELVYAGFDPRVFRDAASRDARRLFTQELLAEVAA